MNSIRIVYRGIYSNYQKPIVDETYIIHKPRNTYESPTWIDYMDKFDGYVIEVTGTYEDTANKIDGCGWIAKPVDREYNDINYYFNINWLEKIDNFSDLDESTVNFFDF